MTYNNTILYSKSKTGKTLLWSASTDYSKNDKGHIVITVTWGQENGKMQTKERVVKSGKNIGKANATTIEEQTDLELKYLYQNQFDSNYFLSIDCYKKPVTPVLAHKFKDKKHKIPLDSLGKFANHYYSQRKYNGIRCLVTITEEPLVFMSRTGKAFRYFPNIELKLRQLFKVGDIVDGELFHHSIPFECITTLVNSDSDKVVKGFDNLDYKNDDIEYYIYDCIPSYLSEEDSFITRFIDYVYTPNFNKNNLPLVIAKTDLVTSFEEVKSNFAEYVNDNYEGLMLRNGLGGYEFGIRSINLLKYKEMEQEEFLIKNIYLAENDSTKVMFTLVNHLATDFPYNEFDCALKGNKDENMKYFIDKDKYIYQSWLTVDYQALSKYSVPLFPVGIVIREGEVVNGKFEPAI